MRSCTVCGMEGIDDIVSANFKGGNHLSVDWCPRCGTLYVVAPIGGKMRAGQSTPVRYAVEDQDDQGGE